MKGRATAPLKLKLKLGETLEFNDLRSLATFFENGPGRNALSISYIDDHTAIGWGRWTIDYAYEAFEHLHRNWDLMRISWLRLCLPYSQAISSVDDPGVWSLLKIRNLQHLTILGPHGCIASNVRKRLRAQTRKKKLFPWRPLGLENAGGKDWIHRQGQTTRQAQYEWLESRYKYLHHRGVVNQRREKQRAAYHKRRRRWPMLSRRRKRRHG